MCFLRFPVQWSFAKWLRFVGRSLTWNPTSWLLGRILVNSLLGRVIVVCNPFPIIPFGVCLLHGILHAAIGEIKLPICIAEHFRCTSSKVCTKTRMFLGLPKPKSLLGKEREKRCSPQSYLNAIQILHASLYWWRNFKKLQINFLERVCTSPAMSSEFPLH